MYIYNTYYVYIYIHIGIVWLRAPNESRPFHSSWTRTFLGGACETCTTSVKRAQLLATVDNFCDFDDMTSSQKLKRTLNQTRPIYIYICLFIYFYTMIYRMMYTSRSWEPDLPPSSKQLRPRSARNVRRALCVAMALAPAFTVISPGATPTVTTLAQEASTVRRNVTGGSSGAGWDVGGDGVLMGFPIFSAWTCSIIFSLWDEVPMDSSGFQWHFGSNTCEFDIVWLWKIGFKLDPKLGSVPGAAVTVAGLAACAAVSRGATRSRRARGPVMVGNANATECLEFTACQNPWVL